MAERKFSVVMLVLLAISVTTTVKAQSTSSTASQTVRLNLRPTIEITAVTPGDVNMNFETISNYSNGVQSNDHEFKVRSNEDFTVSVKSDATNFSYQGSTTPNPIMPVSNTLSLAIAKNKTGGNAVSDQFMNITNSPQNLLVNCKNGEDQRFSINYRSNPGVTYPAGIYTVGIIYTATQP